MLANAPLEGQASGDSTWPKTRPFPRSAPFHANNPKRPLALAHCPPENAKTLRVAKARRGELKARGFFPANPRDDTPALADVLPRRTVHAHAANLARYTHYNHSPSE